MIRSRSLRLSAWAAKPCAVERVGHRLHRGPHRAVPGVERLTGQPRRHRPPVLGADLLGHPFRVRRREQLERPAEQGEDEIVGPHRELGDRVGDGVVALRRATRSPAGDAPGADLEVAPGGELVEVVPRHVGMDADLARNSRRGDAVVGAVIAYEQVDPAAGGVAEGVGDGRHGGREGGAGRHTEIVLPA